MQYRLLPLILLLVLFAACREEGDLVTTTTGSVPPPVVVTPTITSVVIAQDGSPVSDISVTGLGSAATVNPDGTLSIDASQLDPDGSMITVTSPGFWPENRVLMPGPNGGELRETFVMEPKVKAGEINSNTGGTIEIAENFSVTLPANTIATTADGAPYSGAVDVYVNHDAPEDFDEMLNSAINAPGIMEDGSSVSLESYGMMDIALETPNGDPLVLDESTKAEVRMPIEAETAMRGPEQVPFWVLDPDGFWLPAGVATLAPGCYVVYVVSSSTCNIDIPHPTARLCGRFVDPGGFPLTHSPFSVAPVDGMLIGAARIDCNGEFCIDVIADFPLALSVLDPCSGEISTTTTDPIALNETLNLGDIVVDLDNPAFFANVTDCSGNPLVGGDLTEIWANGYGGNDGQYFAPDGDGQTVVSLATCDEEVIVQAFTNDFRASSPVIRRASLDNVPQDFVVCGDLDADEFFTLTIDGTEVPVTELAPIYWPENESFNWQVRAAGIIDGEEYSLFLKFSEPTVGEYSPADAFVAVYRLEPGQAYGEGRVYVDPAQEIGLIGNSVSTDGDIFEGAFNARMNLQNEVAQTVEAVNVSVTASFRIRL